MNVDVLGMLVRRQHAHTDHEALLVEAQRERDLLDSRDQPVPDLCVAEPEIEDRRNPLLRNDDDVDLPPLLFALIDVVAKRENVVVLVDDLVGLRSRAVEPAAKSVVGIGLLPRPLLRARKSSLKSIWPCRVFPACQAGVLLQPVKRSAHERGPEEESADGGRRSGRQPIWPKEPKEWEKLVDDNEVVYEDRHVVVFHDPEDEEHESSARRRARYALRCSRRKKASTA